MIRRSSGALGEAKRNGKSKLDKISPFPSGGLGGERGMRMINPRKTVMTAPIMPLRRCSRNLPFKFTTLKASRDSAPSQKNSEGKISEGKSQAGIERPLA